MIFFYPRDPRDHGIGAGKKNGTMMSHDVTVKHDLTKSLEKHHLGAK